MAIDRIEAGQLNRYELTAFKEAEELLDARLNEFARKREEDSIVFSFSWFKREMQHRGALSPKVLKCLLVTYTELHWSVKLDQRDPKNPKLLFRQKYN